MNSEVNMKKIRLITNNDKNKIKGKMITCENVAKNTKYGGQKKSDKFDISII
jgi:hypothetical protein